MSLRSSLITALVLLNACAPSQRLSRADVAGTRERARVQIAGSSGSDASPLSAVTGAATPGARQGSTAGATEKTRKPSVPAGELLPDDALERGGLELGVFPIDGSTAVLDGDTIRVRGLKSSLRLLGLDTEETFKHEKERNAYAVGWDQYKRTLRGSSDRPVKMATPVGDEAKYFAQRFFEGVTQVRLERDHPLEIRDYFDRYLTYLLVEKGPGNWVNYNVECVRAGMSPYFVKYGRSRRFHKEFLAAQEEARAKKVGIWDPRKQHYDDYEERLKWWNAREEAITRFEKRMEEHPDYIALTRFDALERLEKKLGSTVVLLGAVSDIRSTQDGQTLVKLSKRRGDDFAVVFQNQKVLEASGISRSQGEYVQVRGVVAKYFDRRSNLEKLQLLVSAPGQIIAPNPELETLREKETQHAD